MSLSLYDLFVSMGLFAQSIVIILGGDVHLLVTSASRSCTRSSGPQGETRRFAPEFSASQGGAARRRDQARREAEEETRARVGEALSSQAAARDRATITAADINFGERAVEREILIVSAELKRGLRHPGDDGLHGSLRRPAGTVMGT